MASSATRPSGHCAPPQKASPVDRRRHLRTRRLLQVAAVVEFGRQAATLSGDSQRQQLLRQAAGAAGGSRASASGPEAPSSTPPSSKAPSSTPPSSKAPSSTPPSSAAPSSTPLSSASPSSVAPSSASPLSTPAEETYDPKAHWGIAKPKGLLFDAGDGSTFIMNGWNTRDIMYNALTPAGRARVTKLFTQARSMGLTVVRAMACNDGSRHIIQKNPETFDETVLQALDWVMEESRKFGIRLVLAFAGNWESKSVYASWYKYRSGNNQTVPDDFFRVKDMKDWYKALVTKVISRRNTISGMLYKEDPAVFSWQLMNEPRATSDFSGKTVQDWLREMAAFVKGLDSKHMVSAGVEGFYGPSDPSRFPVNPDRWAEEQGNDFIAEGKIPNIDYLTVHIYPQLWMPGRPYSTWLSFTSKWIKGHAEDCVNQLKMPMVFEEFGWKGDDVNATDARNGFFKVVFDETLEAAKGKATAGTMFWAMEDPSAFFSPWAVWYERDIDSTIGNLGRTVENMASLPGREGGSRAVYVCTAGLCKRRLPHLRFLQRDLRFVPRDLRFVQRDLLFVRWDLRFVHLLFVQRGLRFVRCDLRFVRPDLRFVRPDLRFVQRISSLCSGISALWSGISALFASISALFGGIYALWGEIYALCGGISFPWLVS
ncbi:hypothetical protein CBR_g24351 [Chara braunii]|uniref:mannan endo-1,4-beta-mannosidase n=1 Tax=Chara braunii TaxID=69332 RepID=A0A388JMM8_CHABU|nr:hypothetical protein CBR_g24351 [Chara braunii]|eukprot:GBG59003.1 hypothetical protein CBR_g24351 [Chara braunii]